MHFRAKQKIGFRLLGIAGILLAFCPVAAAPFPPINRDTAAWLEYRDERNGFSVRHPPSWITARELKPYDRDRFFVRLGSTWKKFSYRYDEATNTYPRAITEENPPEQSVQPETLLLQRLDEDPPVRINYLTQLAAFIDVYRWRAREHPRRAIAKALRTERVPLGYTADYMTSMRAISFRPLVEHGQTYGYASLWELVTTPPPSLHPPWTVTVQRIDLIVPQAQRIGENKKRTQTVVALVSSLDLLPRDLFEQLASTLKLTRP